MATYVIKQNDYAGWSPTGRNFALCGALVGAIGLLSWLSLHGYLGSLRPTAAADQLFLAGLVWFGLVGFGVMLLASLGSISLSLQSRGTLTIDDAGVTRSLGKKTFTLDWSEIKGFVPMAYGGVTLVPSANKDRLQIPRFVDDYRACIAELTEHGLQSLPPSSLRRKLSWKQMGLNTLTTFAYLSAMESHHSHATRIAWLCASIVLAILVSRAYASDIYRLESRWVSITLFAALILWAIWRMAHSW